MESFIVNTVHDSILSEVAPNEKEKYDQLARVSMEQDVIRFMRKVYGINFDVPLIAEGSYKKHWSDSEEWQKEYLK